MQAKNKIDPRYAPIKILLSFLIFTEILVWLGPIEYDVNSGVLIPYLLLLNLSLWYGYKKGVENFSPTTYAMSSPTIKTFIVLGFILSWFSLANLWGSHGISVSPASLVDSLLNPGEAYHSEPENEVQTNILMMLLTPLGWAAIPLGIYAWSRLSKVYKFLVFLIILVNVSSWLGIGTRKGIFDIVLIIVPCALAANSSLFAKKSFRRRLKIGTVVFIAAFLVYFTYSNLSRGGLSDFSDLEFFQSNQIKPSYVETIGLPLSVALRGITSYLCQGYLALSKALDMGILPPSIMGSSWFTIALAKKFGYDPTPFTYTKILEADGIDMSINWHSLYVWLANDFTFIGVPFIMLLIGYFFAKSWCDCLVKKNPLAYPLMPLFVMMVFYAFANNQVFSFSFIPFFFWFTFYSLFSRRIV